MKVCSVCRQCYDDSVTICAADDNGSLVQARAGNCLSVEGYRIDFQMENDSPAELYRATHLASEKSVLIRFTKLPDSNSELQKEIETVAAINHPNLARVFEFGKVSGNEFYVVLEDIPGQNLRTFLEQNSVLKERYAIKIARQLAEGLEELHSRGVIHRAVNPANIYFINSENSNFEVKLQNYDFGGIVQTFVAKSANGIDAKTELFRYFSPEQFAGEKIDFKTDIYSLAVFFYEMLLGRSPYDALNPQAILNFDFNESDVQKLHFDLRALLAYTLRQSLQKIIHLRPPTTNNLARQYRHLELVATPPEIGRQKPDSNQTKQRKNVSSYKPFKPQPIETYIVDDVKIPEPKIIEAENLENEPIIANAVEPNFEIFTAEVIPGQQTVEQKLETVLFSEDLPAAGIQNTNVETNLIESQKIEEPEFSDLLERQIENEEIELTDEIDLLDEEKPLHDIHITNRDPIDEAEPELYFAEHLEVTEPEFVETTAEKESPADRHIINSFGAYGHPQSSGINKIYVYAAGSLALLIFAVFITA
ncbi:MAG: serine/threonine-protein kinase, partial [Pyrinomonadaceae bacterium]